MTGDDGAGDRAGLDGLSVAVATERVVGRRDSDPETVRRTLEEISDDGTVSRATVDDALDRLAETIATLDLEAPARALADAREAAAPVADRDVVRARLEAFDEDRSALERRVESLESRRAELIEWAESRDELYPVAREIRRLRGEANEIQEAADALAAEIEAFERMVRTPSAWADQLQGDLDALEESLADLEEVTETLQEAVEGADNGSDEMGATDAEKATAWADAALQHRVRGLFVEDIRAELAALRDIADRREIELEESNAVEQRLETLAARRTDIGRRLDEVFRPSWSRGYGETVLSFSRALEEFDPPVDWEALQAELERHRDRLED